MKRILTIAYYEWRTILHNPILLLMVFFVPLLYGLLFGSIYFHPIITHIPTAIIDEDHSELSRRIADAYRSSPAFSVQEEITNYSEMEAAMRDGRIRAGIVIQKDLEQHAEKIQDAKVFAVYDASNLIWGYNIRKNMRLVINDFNAAWVAEKVDALGFDNYQKEQLIHPVDYNIEVWYNPTYSYANFMLYGLFFMIIHQVGLLCTALVIPREREKGSWIQFQTASISRFSILFGKCLPYLLVFLLHYLLLLHIGVTFFHMSFAGNTLWLLLLGLVYVSLMLLLGYVLAYYLPNSLQATRFIMLISVPIVISSGMIWPSTHIPTLLYSFMQLFPFKKKKKMIRILAQKSGGWEQFSGCISALFLMLIVIFLFFILCCPKQERLKKGKPQSIHQ